MSNERIGPVTRTQKNTSLLLLLLLGRGPAAASRANTIDSIKFGDAADEKAHRLEATRSEPVKGSLDQHARQLLPLETPGPDGGKVTFTLMVDPKQPNYFTL